VTIAKLENEIEALSLDFGARDDDQSMKKTQTLLEMISGAQRELKNKDKPKEKE
jgi:hypothetical protein